MAPASRSSWPGLAAILVLFLCLLNLTTASPVPDNHEPEHKTLNKRASITQARYEAYLKKYFPATNRYMLYTGNSETQLKFFQSKNKASGYLYYADLFNVPQSDIDEPDVKKRKHPWWKAFDEDNDMDDGEASSKALANLASGDVLIFGGIEYKTEGANSFFTRQEIDLLHAGLRSGRIKSLKHMAKDAKSTSDVIATEDADGVLTFIPPATAATKNAGPCALTKRAGSSCYGPKKPNSKKTSKCGSGKSKSKTGKGKRATASDAACPMPSARPTATKTTKAPVASATRKATPTRKATKPTATKKPTTKKPTTKKPKKKVL